MNIHLNWCKRYNKRKIKFESKYNLDYFNIFDNGWQTNTGFLNDEIQEFMIMITIMLFLFCKIKSSI